MLSICARSENNRVDCGSNVFFRGEVYSETLRKPKKAVRMAAQIISLSSYSVDDRNNCCCICRSMGGVIASLFFFLKRDPWECFMPLMSR